MLPCIHLFSFSLSLSLLPPNFHTDRLRWSPTVATWEGWRGNSVPTVPCPTMLHHQRRFSSMWLQECPWKSTKLWVSRRPASHLVLITPCGFMNCGHFRLSHDWSSRSGLWWSLKICFRKKGVISSPLSWCRFPISTGSDCFLTHCLSTYNSWILKKELASQVGLKCDPTFYETNCIAQRCTVCACWCLVLILACVVVVTRWWLHKWCLKIFSLLMRPS